MHFAMVTGDRISTFQGMVNEILFSSMALKHTDFNSENLKKGRYSIVREQKF